MRIIQLTLVVGIVLFVVCGPAQRSALFREAEHRWAQLTDSVPDWKPANTSDFRGSDVNIHSAPSMSSDVLGTGREGDGVRVDHSSDGQAVTCPDGHSNTRWLHISDQRSRITGFVSSCYL
jgi:hypothetical protein